MMKHYEKPEIELIAIEAKDIITASGFNPDEGIDGELDPVVN